jgi:rare lipoprotein A
MYAMTACHPTLPFGSLVRVVNLDNNRSVVVRITDRGYLIKGRVIDLSYGAAKELAILKPGIAPVKLEVLSLGGSHRKK